MSEHKYNRAKRGTRRFAGLSQLTSLIACVATGGCLSKLNHLGDESNKTPSNPETVVAPATPSGSEPAPSDPGADTSNGATPTNVSPPNRAETSEPHVGSDATTPEATERSVTSETSGPTPSSRGDDTGIAPSPDAPDASPTAPDFTSETQERSEIGANDSTSATAVATSAPNPESTLGDSSSVTSSASTAAPDSPPEFFDSGHGLLLWLDAADDASFTGSGAVAAWNDRSGNAAHVSQTSVSAQPSRILDGIGGLPVVRFDGLDDALRTQAALTNRGFEGFMVWRSTRVPPNTKSTLLANARNFEVNHGHISSSARAAVSVCVGDKCESLNSGWYDANFDQGALPNTAYLWHFAFDQATNQLYADAWGGLRVTKGGATESPVPPTTPFAVGNCNESNCSFLGDIAEVVLFDAALGESEQAQTLAYLAAKWSLTAPSE